MEPGSLTWLGSPCGSHGPYIFYKAFRFNLDGKKRLLSLGDFFLVRCQPGEPLCVAELQLLWEERTNHQLLSSSKLYFLPEDTPQGRSASHGQDEVIAVSEKVVVRLEDLVKWTVWDREAWNRGMKALPLKISSKRSTTDSFVRYHDPTLNGGLHFKDVMKEKAALGEGLGQKQVLVLSYPRYCRYRSVVARLREQPRSLLTNEVVLALGGIAVPSENTHILYCRDTFCHPTLLHNESICDEFAPNLKGRPRKKKLLNCLHRDSHDQSQGLEVKGYCQKSSKETEATAGETTVEVTADKAGVTKVKDSRISSVNHSTTLALPVERRRRGRGLQYKAEEQAFLVSLYKYMKERKTPIERIPYLGFKQINLWTMFQAAQSLGGYELITARRQWKNVYDELGGNPGSTSAATCTRRHYERLILPYERFIRGEEDKPVPQLKPGKLEASTSKGSSSSICTPILKTEACPEKNDTLESRDQDQSRLVLEQNSQLKLEPQICITRLDSLQPLLSVRKRQSPTQDSQNDPAIQLMQEHKEEVKRKRRYSGCDPSYLTTYPMTKGESVLPLATPKIFNHGHLAVDLWQHQQVPLQDLCHIGKPRNLQSPTIPEPPSEQAELPRTEDTSSGFTTLFESSGASKAIMSPLVKKKLLLQVSSTGLPKQGHCHSNFGQSPPLITPSSTNCITEEPAERPAVAADSSVSRPSVIQHVQSFKTTVQKDRARQVKESTPPVNSHKHHFHLVPPSHSPIPLLSHQKESQCPSTPLLTPKMPQSSWTPRAFPIDLFSSVSYLDYRHRAAEKADGTVNVELVHDGSKQPQEQEATLPRDPKSLVRFLQSDDDSKYSTPTDQGNSPNPRTLLSDDQPTDLSLPKSSLKPLHHPCPSGPLKYSTRYQDSTPVLPQNGLTDINIAHYLRAWRVPPSSVSLAHTCNPRRDPAAERFRATEEAVVGTVHNGEVVKKQKVGDKEEQEQLQTALYNRMRTEALGSQMVLHNACVAHPLNNLGNSISKRRRQTITPIPKDVLSSSPSREIETPKDDSVVGESAEGAEGGAPASPFSILNPTSQVYPNILNPSGTLALYQVQNLCRDTFSIPLIMDQPHCSKSHLQNPLQYLKTQSTDFDSSLVPPIAIHSSIAQRQLLVQASASPIHIYQQTYGDVLHHKLYPMSVNPHPTFSQPPSVHPSTKLP